jgi:hypothetical protein
MGYSLPILLRPGNINAESLKNSKSKFHYLTLDNRKADTIVIRQFIHEINVANPGPQSVLRLYKNTTLISYSLNDPTVGSKNELQIDFANLTHKLKYQTDSTDFFAGIIDQTLLSTSKSLYIELELHDKQDTMEVPKKKADLLTPRYPIAETNYNSSICESCKLLENTSNLELEISDKSDKFENPLIVYFKVCYSKENNTYYDIIQIVVLKERSVWYGALDFGSEASQMSFVSSINTVNKKFQLGMEVNFIKVLEELYRTNSPHGYWQTDSDDTSRLYRSIFEISDSPSLSRKNNIFPHDDYPINFLKPLNEIFDEHSRILPNLKLFKQIEMFESIKAKFIHLNTEYGSLYHCIVANMIGFGIIDLFQHYNTHKRAIDGINNTIKIPKGLIIRVLVPNMYSSSEIAELTNAVQKHLFGIRTRIQEIYTNHDSNNLPHTLIVEKISNFLEAIELNVLSEGDAVAVFYNKNYNEIHLDKFNTAEKFVVVDCGKGTTDISVLKKDNGVLDTHFRGGFAGAGNALSRAIFDDFLAAEGNNTDSNVNLFVDGLKDLNKATTGTKMRVGEIIDNVKKEFYNSLLKPNQIENILTQASIGSSPTFDTILDKLYHDPTLKNIEVKMTRNSDKALDAILTEIIHLLKIAGLKKSEENKTLIILSGRIFKSTTISKKFIEVISKEFGMDGNCGESEGLTNNNLNFALKVEELKSSSVNGGIEEATALNLNSDIIGIPMTYKKTKWLLSNTNKFKINSLNISLHDIKYYTLNLIKSNELRGNSSLFLNRFKLTNAYSLETKNLVGLYYIGNGYVGIYKDGKKYKSTILEPKYSEPVLIEDMNSTQETAAETVTKRYEELLKASFFPHLIL